MYDDFEIGIRGQYYLGNIIENIQFLSVLW